MTQDFKARLSDFFEAWELAEFLQLRTEDIVNAFEDEIEELEEELEEFMEIGVRK